MNLEQKESIFLNEISPERCEDDYLKAIYWLTHSLRDGITIINTCGWVGGVGNDLL